MRILVINAGSTSLKYKLFALPHFKVIAEDNFQNIENHATALKEALRDIGDLRDIVAIGHRIVHGGSEFRKTTRLTPAILKKLTRANSLAPLHNPANLAGVHACQKYLPTLPHYACFDTAYFADLPRKAKIYPIPLHFYNQEKIQRYGFHGLSHQYVANEAAQRLHRPIEELKLITVHLGGGWSITATKKGKPIDTSMGFTPQEGLAMLTRAGDLDSGIILHLLKKHSLEEMDALLNHQSGIKGLSGYNNYLHLLKAVAAGKPQALLAFEICIYRLQKYIGAYYAILNGIDALVFSGQIGAGKPLTRQTVVKGLSKILKDVPILAIKTEEEKMIAREVSQMIEK